MCHTVKAKSSASTPTDVHALTKGPPVDTAGLLFESKGTGAMPTGLFKALDHSVQVDYDGVSIPIPRSTYEKNGYKPDFDSLPPEAEYRAAKEKLGNVPRP